MTSAAITHAPVASLVPVYERMTVRTTPAAAISFQNPGTTS
jgi:hypothetical protein